MVTDPVERAGSASQAAGFTFILLELIFVAAVCRIDYRLSASSKGYKGPL